MRVVVLALIAMAVVAAVVGVSYTRFNDATAIAGQKATVNSGLKLLLMSDANREELEAKIYKAMWSSSDPTAEHDPALVSDAAGIVKKIQQNGQVAAALNLPASLRQPTLDQVQALDNYATGAYALIASATTDRSGALADLAVLNASDGALTTGIEGIITNFRSESARLDEVESTGSTRGKVFFVAAGVLADLLLIFAGVWMARSVTRSVRRVSRAAERMTGGDLATRIRHDARDDVGVLAESINTLAQSLQASFGRLETDARRESFNTKLVEALEMVDTESEVHLTISEAIGKIIEGPTELLLADSSRAHLERASCHPTAGSPGCPVESTWNCAAIRRGNPIVFESSSELNACPKLKGRPGGDLSAVCVPVSFMGRNLGVLHTTTPDHAPPSAEIVTRLTQLAALAGSRMGTVRAFQQSQTQAATDALTGLPNRRSAEATVHDKFASGEVFSFAMADLDFFKRLNDSYGHEMGDKALRLFSKTMTDTLRETDIAARWGGEEFAIVMPGLRTHQAIEVLDRLRHALAVATMTGDTPSFTASFGVTDSATVGNIELLVRTADDALYAAKEQGRDRVVAGDPTRVSTATVRRTPDHESRIDIETILGR